MTTDTRSAALSSIWMRISAALFVSTVTCGLLTAPAPVARADDEKYEEFYTVRHDESIQFDQQEPN